MDESVACSETAPFGGAVNFSVENAAKDVVRHEYWFDGQAAHGWITGNPATVALKPPHEGRNTLHVRSFDSAQHAGRPADFRLFVKAASPPVGDWSFDDGSGTNAADSAATPHPLTVYGGGAFDDAGRDGKSLQLDGVNDYAETPTAVVDTTKSFTISAWARLWTASDAVVVSGAGNIASAFQLSYSAAAKQWVFQRATTDAMSPAVIKAVSDEPAVLGTWTHLAGVYDSGTSQLQLYVNGRRQGQGTATYPFDKAWKAAGPLSVGRGLYNDAYRSSFPGSIDRVQVWQRALYDYQVMAVTDVKKDGQAVVSPAARWRLDDAAPGADQIWRTSETVYGANMVISGFGSGADQSAPFVEDDDRGKVLQFTGAATEALSLSRPVVDAGTTFSVAVWVKLADPTKPAVVARQAGTDRDAWRLAWQPGAPGAFGGQWEFTRAPSGAGDESKAVFPEDYDAFANDEWRLLIGTYNANAPSPTEAGQLGAIDLTMNSITRDQGLVAHTSPYRLGSTVIGKGRTAGGEFAGLVDDFRMYVGPLAGGAICTEFPEIGSTNCPTAG
jgi:hypothetical protein